MVDMMTTNKCTPNRKRVFDIHRILFKYVGAPCSVSGFKPMPLNTNFIDNVEAGAKVKLFLRPAHELQKNHDMADALHKGWEECKHLESPMKEISVYATVADELRKKGYDLDLLFENGYALHIDTLDLW